MDCEATPTLPPVPGVDLQEYKYTLIERFSNPQVGDTIARLCAQSSDRIPKWVLPVIRQQLATGGELWRSAAVVASWARYAEGLDDHGEPIEVVDRLLTASHSSPGGSARTPTRSSPTVACSGTSPTTGVRHRLPVRTCLTAPAWGTSDAGVTCVTIAPAETAQVTSSGDFLSRVTRRGIVAPHL